MQSPRVPADAKGDHQIKALGATVMVQREAGREFLQLIFPQAADPDLHIDKLKLVKELARGFGYDVSQIQYSEDEQKQRDQQRAQQPPPQDPRVEAAQIRAKAVEAQIEQDAKDGEAQRALDAQQAELDRQNSLLIEQLRVKVQEMVLAGEQNISLEQVKAALAGQAMTNRTKMTEMQLKLDPANRTHTGI
jgi:hypothetical protein